MKLIDKDAVVAEIDRIKKEDYYDIHDEYDGFVRNALDKVLSFINTLQEEYKLTLQDIKRVILLEHHAIADDRCHHKLMTQEDLYKEILKRINDEQTSRTD